MTTLRAALIGRVQRRVLNVIQSDAGMEWAHVRTRLQAAYGGGRWAPTEDMLHLLRAERGRQQTAGEFAATLLTGHHRILEKLGEQQETPLSAALALVLPELLKAQLTLETGQALDGRGFMEAARGMVDSSERDAEREAWSKRARGPPEWGQEVERQRPQPGRRHRPGGGEIRGGDWRRTTRPTPRGGASPPMRRDRSRKPQRGGDCFECGRPGHLAVRCPLVRCFECRETGHMARHCPWIKRQPRGGQGEPMEVNFQRVTRGNTKRRPTEDRDSDDTTSSESDSGGPDIRPKEEEPHTMRSYAGVLRGSRRTAQRT